MAHAYADRVKETSTTTGTGTYDLAGAVDSLHQTFVAGIGDGNTCYYVAVASDGWEVGIGTVTDASPDTLARTQVLASSNSGSAVSWGAGTKTIFCGIPAGRVLAPRITSESSSATPTINTDNTDLHRITALAADITSMTTNLSGTPVHGQKLIVEITGTATRAITWGASFESSTATLPTTTNGTNLLRIALMYNSATSKWSCVAVA